MDAQKKGQLAWASQPRTRVWRQWLTLLAGKLPLEEIRRLYQPPIHLVCEPLLGRMIQCGDIRKNCLPSLAERILIFREAIAIIEAFHAYDELPTLAAYRRQVTNVGGEASVDRPLFRLITSARPALSMSQIRALSERMPPRSPIHRELKILANERCLFAGEPLRELELAAD